jgi:hypothetical protein
MKQQITCNIWPGLSGSSSDRNKARAELISGRLMRRGIAAFAVIALQSCAMRPAPVRDVSIIETQPDLTATQSTAGKTRRRSPDDFERHTFPAAEKESDDDSQRSNRRVPSDILGGLEGDGPAKEFIEQQDKEIAEKSGNAPLAVKIIWRSGTKRPDETKKARYASATN